MAVKNLQTLALCVANTNGVRVTGTACNDSMRADGKSQAHFLSLPWRLLPGLYPIRTGPTALFAKQNPAAAEAVQRTGRSSGRVGVCPSIRLTRSASRAVLSTGRIAGRTLKPVVG